MDREALFRELAEVAEDAKRKALRRDEIIRLLAADVSPVGRPAKGQRGVYSEIAEVAGISRGRVHQIVKEGADRAPGDAA